MGTCQYPLFKSRVVNQRAPCSSSRRSSMRGMGWASLIVAALSCLKPTENWRLPSFFFTMTTGEAQGLLEGWITPLDSICCTCAISSLHSAGFWQQCFWRSGGSSVSMVCWSSGVQPKSSPPWLMMSLNSWKRAFSCSCWVGERCSRTGGWRFWLAAGGGGGESVRVTISKVPTVCPMCRRRDSGRWLCIATQTSDPLVSAVTSDTNMGRPSSGQKHTSSLGQGLWQRTSCAVLAGMSTACNSRVRLAGEFCIWAALRWMVCGSGCAGVTVPRVTSMWTRRGRMMSFPIKTGSDLRPMITMKVALPQASPHCRFRCWVFLVIWRGLPCALWTTPSKGFKWPHWVRYCYHSENPIQVTDAPVSTRPRTGMPSRLSWPVMGDPATSQQGSPWPQVTPLTA